MVTCQADRIKTPQRGLGLRKLKSLEIYLRFLRDRVIIWNTSLRQTREPREFLTNGRADEITVSAPDERVDLVLLKATKARRKGAER